MAFGVIAAGAAIKGIGARRSKKASKKAAKEQRRLDAENTALYQREVGESIRRAEVSNRGTEGFARTQIGSSGFGQGSSLDSYLDSMRESHTSDIDWMRESGASNVAIQEREAAARQRNANAMAKANFTSAIGSSLMTLGSGYQW